MVEINKILTGDCREILKTFPDNYFDSCVTDPPYGISFMNRHWDYDVPAIELWKEVFRVLKPGGHILSAGGTRTYHRMVCAIEDAGFEIRDTITWIYGSGFPKSLDISKAIDRQAGAERKVIGKRKVTESDIGQSSGWNYLNTSSGEYNYTAPSTPAAKQWQGYGTALKPATEMFCLARKPLSESIVAENVLKHGTGGLNIDDCRIETDDSLNGGSGRIGGFAGKEQGGELSEYRVIGNNTGRFPANLILDEFAAGELDKQSGMLTSGISEDGASRFFYCAKADQSERNKGLKGFENKPFAASNQAKAELKRGNTEFENNNDKNSSWSSINMRQNHHPTVKPVDLMQYLVRLITPKHGIVLDPFAGSGTTCIAAKLELINYIGIEIDPEYAAIAEARINAWNPEKYIEQKLFHEPAEKHIEPYLRQQLLF